MLHDATQTQLLLNENVESFFSKFLAKHAANMNCQNSCCRCCYTSLTVFASEALVIAEWFAEMASAARQEQIREWREASRVPGEDASGVVQPPCVFLSRRGRCTIYSARPIICRTQGLALLLSVSANEGEPEQLDISHCPLNFTAENSLPPKNEWLDLRRLNTLQSLAAKIPAAKIESTLPGVRADEDGRIALSDLRDFLTAQASAHTAE